MKTSIKKLSVSGLIITCSTLLASPVMAEDYMVRYCKSAVATDYHVNQKEIRTLPIESTHNKFIVYGQTPKDGQNALFFTCTFDSSKNFLHLKKVSDTRSNSNGVSDTVDRSQMPAFCRGMAAEKFNQRPQDITTQAVEREDGKFYVYG